MNISDKAIAARDGGAVLPASYVNAKIALAQCQAVDECKDWADKAAALAAYAKQANDIELEQMAARIRARAMRRAGELLKQFDGRGNNQHRIGADTTQQDAAEQAGFSKRQKDNAVRIANIPEADFEAQVESESPPTITALSEQGKRPQLRPEDYLKGRSPKAFNKALHFVAAMLEYVEELKAADLELILPNLDERQAGDVRRAIQEIDATHDIIITRI